MKNVLMIAVCAMGLSLVACGGEKKPAAPAVETPAVEAPAVEVPEAPAVEAPAAPAAPAAE